MLYRVLDKAKKEGGKKIPINFQVPSELKERFEELCKKNEVSITSMLTGLMETAIEEAQGIYFELDAQSLLAINNQIKEIENELDGMSDFIMHKGEPLRVPDLRAPEDLVYYEEKRDELLRLTKIFKNFKGSNHAE